MAMNNRRYMDQETAKKVYQTVNKVYTTGKPAKGFDWEIMRKGGTKRPVESSVSLIRDAEGQAIGFRGIVRDITERKRAEEALRESEERFRVLVEESPLGVSLIEKNGHYKYINPKFSEIFGYSLEDIPTAQVWFRKAYPDQEYRKQVISTWISDIEEIKAGESRSRIYNVRCKDGSEKTIHFRPVVMENEEHFVISEDITEQRCLEAQLQYAQRMESMGTLAGGIAHNFNNLLMAIQGNASLMLLGTESAHPNYERLKGIEKSVQSGSRLTSQLLGYAREGKYEIKPISLNQVVEETSDTFATAKREITVHRKLAGDLSGIKADQGQIEQALLNLYVNAADAMPGGGDLFLETTNATHDDMRGKPYTAMPGDYVLLTVRDTGIGIDNKTMERIFDPFFTTKGLAKGTGLGLASVYGILKAHGGYIEVGSKKGQGTTFSIYLPASQERVEKPLTGGEHIVEGGETILLVDDEEMVLGVGIQLLKALGYTVLEAKGGREAVDIYKANKDKIDMVILDMVMPGIGGSEAYDRMKEINPDIKVLLSSGYSIDGRAAEILERGCNGFIQKPFSMRELSQKTREILEKN
jgi:two-component system cell cycle sensor histidine kinase/response regulator CckA